MFFIDVSKVKKKKWISKGILGNRRKQLNTKEEKINSHVE